jgi:hypothetical protein
MKKNLTDAARLHNIENGILGTRKHPEILERINSYGYTAARITRVKNAGTREKNEWRITSEP